MAAISGEVGEEGHGPMAEAVNENGLEDALGVMEDPANERYFLSELHVVLSCYSRVKVVLKEVKDGIQHYWTSIFNTIYCSVSNLRSQILEIKNFTVLERVIGNCLAFYKGCVVLRWDGEPLPLWVVLREFLGIQLLELLHRSFPINF